MKNAKGLIPIVIVGVIFIIAAALVASYWWYQQKAQDLALANTAQQLITDFDSCAAAGYPVMESYPRQCAANGKTYTEIITNTNAAVCRHYFDGCNTCSINDDGAVLCTTRFCTPEEREPYRCLDNTNNNSSVNTNSNVNSGICTPETCAQYRYGSCPSECAQKCVPSVCSKDSSGQTICTADCNGEGGCYCKDANTNANNTNVAPL